MNITIMFNDAIKRINDFLRSSKRDYELRFKDGFFVKLKKHVKNKESFLEIHTSGYDDTLPIKEAIEWLQWTLYDYKANGILG